jgi:uncharacterized protein with PQ loop repeat
MDDDYLMYIATSLYFACYVPILYADFKNKNANLNNLPERILSIAAGMFAILYAIRVDSTPLKVNYIPHVIIESLVLGVKIIYVYRNGCSTDTVDNVLIQSSKSPIHP